MTTFSYNGTVVQQYTIPTSGTYEIIVDGAQGGGQFGASGGEGGEVSGETILAAGTVIDILVGGAGAGGGGSTGGGGGGGSFVEIDGQTTPLLVAGGGGGGYVESNGGAGGFSANSTAGGSSAGFYPGGGGGGLVGDGATEDSSSGLGGASFEDGGAGGAGFDTGSSTGDGGYGGGGGGGYSGGGGGGYQGGDAGVMDSGGGGGGSYAGLALDDVSYVVGAHSGNGEVTFDLVCFAAGTRIATPGGEVVIESLAVGDLVLTASGEARPIRWLGHRKVDLRAHPRPAEAVPVRIAAHAFGPGRPARDLHVSPAHALGFDAIGGILVPAGRLRNGSTVDQPDRDSVVYWHIELDSHDLLLAEGLPVESYLDVGNRSFFADSSVVALRPTPDGDAERRSEAVFCRPLHVDGALVEALRRETRQRAATLGWRLETHPFAGLHLLVDGARGDPALDGGFARFPIAAGAREVWLVSHASRPCDAGDSADERRLGVAVASFLADDGQTVRRLDADDPRLVQGFYEAETNAGSAWRWTSGRARVPAELWASSGGDVSLAIALAAGPPPRWQAPEAPEGDLMSRPLRRA